MIDRIYKYFLYSSLYYNIKDYEIRRVFYENTRNKYTYWDDKKFDKMFEIVNKKYEDIEKTYTNIFYLSMPEIVILFLKDEKMLNILEEYKKVEEEINKKVEENYEREEIEFKKYNFIYEKLHNMYPRRF